MITNLRPFRAEYLTNPPQELLRELAKEHTPAIVETTVGNLDKFQSKSMINIPLGDTVAAKLNYNYTQRDGIVQNKGRGEIYKIQRIKIHHRVLLSVVGRDDAADSRFTANLAYRHND